MNATQRVICGSRSGDDRCRSLCGMTPCLLVSGYLLSGRVGSLHVQGSLRRISRMESSVYCAD